ncbi:hypothetical protein [Geminocystis sp. GBBB08]|uniref:hypothetical protein n=1 Tax=Geminocystis sp. GBBB08 TaxID=2604140 RepID=UPI0027E24409|nr:hypothetical protein [Geminocystis sp. GBBB08]MBL1211197.1 hypothetical protein [Geminocystis sp. GBBB08]
MVKFISFIRVFSLLILFTNSLILPSFSISDNFNKTSPPLTKEKGWSVWNLWVNFPFEIIEVGLSNLDLGKMLDFEYSCFGSVGDENNTLKQETYWYRIADKVTKIGKNKYLQIEVGCWLNDNFKSTTTLMGIINN